MIIYSEKDQRIVTRIEVKQAHRNISFPQLGPSEMWLNENGYYLIKNEQPPDTENGFMAVNSGVEKFGSGYRFKWDIISVPQPSYEEMRRIKFEPLDGEGMDAMRKELQALRAAVGGEPDEAVKTYFDKISAIKALHPKS